MKEAKQTTEIYKRARKETCDDPKQTTSSVKHGGGRVMVWACMTANGTGSLVFTDDVTADGCMQKNLLN